MVVRIVIAVFASCVGGFGYLAGLIRLTSGLLLGLGALSSYFFALLFWLSPGTEQTLFPLSVSQPPLPYLLLGIILSVLVYILFAKPRAPSSPEEAGGSHFTSLLWGMIGYIATLFVSALFWFPSDDFAGDPLHSGWMSLGGTVVFLAGISLSCLYLYRSTRGGTARHPDLMRRFVLALFAFFQLDKVPLVATYLLISDGREGSIFMASAALALAGYLPVAVFLLRATWDCRGEEVDG